MIATTIEQSKHLLEFGLDPKTADMIWRYVTSGCYRLEVLHKELFEGTNEKDIPAWSLSALLEVMPKAVEYNGNTYILRLQYEEGVAPFMYYVVQKGEIKGRLIRFKNGRCVPDAYDALDAAYQLTTWLLEQGLIKKGDRE